jgi:electron transfer flavoprotein beta subunit
MNILVCVKRVPDTGENEILPNSGGTDIQRNDFVYAVNEWDNYAVEEAIRIRERGGGSVTVATVGREEDDEVLRREIGMGADRGIHVMDRAFGGLDGREIATLLKAVAERGHYDLILTGVQADDGAGQVGGMLAAMLDWPYASIVSRLEIMDERTIRVHREVAGGNEEIYEMDLPCVLSVQTGINEPRYVSVRGVMKAAGVEIPVYTPSELALPPDATGSPGSMLKRLSYVVPDVGEGAEMLEGRLETVVDRLFDVLKSKGGIKA